MTVSSYPRIRRRPPVSVDWPGVPPLLARILAGRGLTAAEQLELTLGRLPHPDHFQGLAAAVDQAIVESLFEYRPAEWFGKRSAYPEVPAWKDAGPAVRNDYRRLGTMLLARPRLEGRARESIEKVMALLPGR